MAPWERYAILAHVSTAVVTAVIVAVIRPPRPARLEGKRGVIALLGWWAYWVTSPALRAAKRLGITADGMTAIGTSLSIGAGVAAGAGRWGLAGILLLWGATCDILDGELARSTGQQTRAGAFLDSNLDRVSEIALFAGLALSFPDRAGELWAWAAIPTSLMVSYARARGEGLGVACPPFGLERAERVVPFLFALNLAPFFGERVATLVLEGLCVYVTLGAGVTAAGRILVIHRILRRGEQAPADAPAQVGGKETAKVPARTDARAR
ncbi:MAG TPA: CDP-alcohol phosphatidyltransferase family protein [Anaeromyxobacteraceae bacterium]|nr:CDP-alcohol phosphatidyltransferase family protein [Anaeromyxobacteraceae bacterium]